MAYNDELLTTVCILEGILQVIMKNIKLLIAASIILLSILFFTNFLRIDIASSKNHALMIWDEEEIRNIQNIDSAKVNAIHWREIIRKNFVEDSNISARQLAIVFAILILQVVLLVKLKKKQLVHQSLQIFPYHLNKIIKQIPAIMRAGCTFRMVLN